MSTGIYKITNKINNKIYIGKSVNIERRWQQEINGYSCNKHLFKSFNLHGVENFSFEILEECKKEILNEKEIYYISYFNSTDQNLGYNITLGGDGIVNVSDEHRKIIAESNKKNPRRKGKKNSKEHRERISNSNKGKKLSKEHKEKISNSNKGRKFSEIHLANLKSTCSSMEHREKLSKSLTGHQVSEETRNKLREKNKNKKLSQKQKEKCIKALLESNIKKRKKIICVSDNKEFSSIVEASKFYGLNPSAISGVCLGRYKQTGGKIFKYKEEKNE